MAECVDPETTTQVTSTPSSQQEQSRSLCGGADWFSRAAIDSRAVAVSLEGQRDSKLLFEAVEIFGDTVIAPQTEAVDAASSEGDTIALRTALAAVGPR